MKALLDLDIPKYSIAFASEDDPVENALHSVKVWIEETVKAAGCDSYQGYLTSSTSWRKDKYPDYKGNRKQEKPRHFDAIEKYMVKHGAIMIDDGREADDGIIDVHLHNYNTVDITETCVVSSDKDLNTCPGWHYNPKWDVKYFIRPIHANLFFWCQMIMGDTADNIKGIPGKGKMAAYKAFADLDSWSNDVLRVATFEMYLEHYKSLPEAWEMFRKNYELLAIGKHRQEMV